MFEKLSITCHSLHFFRFQALAVTRVNISPKEGGPNDVPSIHSQGGIFKNRKFSGSGSDTDIITSSARAYVSALNKLLSWNARRTKQGEDDINEEASNADAVAAEPMAVAEAH
jgi:2-isopropylmalate synthase